MPIPWLSVLKLVPWTDVISNAPKVADGAKKLWSSVGKQPPPTPAPPASEQAQPASESEAFAALRTQLAAAEAAVSDLHGQMVTSSELIKALAEQNTQLIKRVEVNRMRIVWLAAATAVLGVIAVASLVMGLTP